METKKCTRCGEAKALDEFRQKKRRSGNGRSPYPECRQCERQEAQKYRLLNPEKTKKALADWKKKNPAKNAAHSRASYGRRKTKCRETALRWISMNRDRYLLWLRDYGRRSREALTDTYVAHTIRMSVFLAPKYLVELKRAKIQIFRDTKQLLKTINEKQHDY